MNILLSTFWDFPHVGGVSTHIETLSSGLRALGHQATVLSNNVVHEVLQNPQLATEQVSLSTSVKYLSNSFCQSYDFQRSIFEFVLSHIDLSPFDIIAPQDVIAATCIRRVTTTKPMFLTVHGYLARETLSEGAITDGSEEESYLIKIEREAITTANGIMTVDNRLKDYLVNDLEYKKTPFVMHNFVNTEVLKNCAMEPDRRDLGIADDSFVIVAPRRLTAKNGVVQAAMAMKLLIENIPNAVLYFLGDGSERNKLAQYIRENGLEQHCVILGGVEHSATLKYLASADIILVPSVPSAGVEEATSIAALEGMGMSKPVVAGNVGGLKELLDHRKNGMLVDATDAEQLSHVLFELHRNPSLRRGLGEQARLTVATKHSHVTAAKQYLEQCQILLRD